MSNKGFTLVEVLVALLITAVITMAVFTIALSSRSSGGKADRRLIANEYVRELSDLLRNYVADSTGMSSSPGNLMGPAGGGWYLPGDSCAPGCYALAPGVHTVNNFLPSSFSNAPYNAKLTYTVSAGTPPQVNISLTWTDPNY